MCRRYGMEVKPDNASDDFDQLMSSISSIHLMADEYRSTTIKKRILTDLESRLWRTNLTPVVNAPFRVSAIGRNGLIVQTQFGNMANAYYDLLKLQTVHEREGATGALVLPTPALAKRLGSNFANSATITKSLDWGMEKVVSLPLYIVGVE